MTLRAATALIGLAALTLSGCTSGGSDTTETSVSASVTQTAPSVWSPPETTPVSEVETTTAADSDDPLANTPSPLPGLSTACTVTIHAQAGVNDLFAKALQSAEQLEPSSTAPSSDASTVDASDDAADDGAPALGADEVAELFDKIMRHVPAAITKHFTRLRTAATDMTTEPARAVPDILADPDVVAATKAIGAYITDCTPTDGD